jgi:hypothetical protein
MPRWRKARKDFLIAAGLPSAFLCSSYLLTFCLSVLPASLLKLRRSKLSSACPAAAFLAKLDCSFLLVELATDPHRRTQTKKRPLAAATRGIPWFAGLLKLKGFEKVCAAARTFVVDQRSVK